MNTLSGADFEIIPTNIICLLTTCEQAHHESVLPHVLAVPSVTGQPDWQCQKRSGQSRGIKTRRRARCKRKGFNPRATIHHSQSARVYTDKHGSHKSIFPQKTGLSLLCHSWEWQSRLNPEKSKKKGFWTRLNVRMDSGWKRVARGGCRPSACRAPSTSEIPKLLLVSFNG